MRHPNVYGIDMPAPEELIAHGRNTEEIAEEIGADWLVYQDLDDLIACAREGNPELESFDCSVFDGVYPTGDIDAGYLQQVRDTRNDAVRAAAGAAGVGFDVARLTAILHPESLDGFGGFESKGLASSV